MQASSVKLGLVLGFIHTAGIDFYPDGPFSVRALSLLEAATGIPVTNMLSDYTEQIQNILGLVTNLELKSVLNVWEREAGRVAPTWHNLLLIIRLLGLDELAQRMETYLSTGTTEEPHGHPEVETERVTKEEGETYFIICYARLRC